MNEMRDVISGCIIASAFEAQTVVAFMKLVTNSPSPAQPSPEQCHDPISNTNTLA